MLSGWDIVYRMIKGAVRYVCLGDRPKPSIRRSLISSSSSVSTLNCASLVRPKLVEMAPSAASRPRATTMRPMRGRLPRIESKPSSSKKRFEPHTEIHWRGIWRNTDIAQIAGAVPCRDVHATTQSDRKMGKVTAYPHPFVECVKSRTVVACVTIAKFDLGMREVADGLHRLPPRPRM
jgi:hypothetical protein